MTKTQIALQRLSEERFQEAHQLLSECLINDPSNLEAQMGILIWDMAQTHTSKALGLLEFYFALLSEISPREAQKKIISTIHLSDQNDNQTFEYLSNSLTQNIESHSCISYEDFKRFVFGKSNFKEAFDDFALSTKIIFSHKDEVYEFLNLLIDQGYANLSMQYAENIGENVGFDLDLNQILQRAIEHLK